MNEPKSYDQIDPQTIQIGWKDGTSRIYSARALRLACPCAACVDENTGRPLLDPSSVPEDIAIEGAHLVGRYAFQFVFSDGHSTGIFTFDWLDSAGQPA